MIQNKIQQIPIVDEKKKILGVHFWDEINTANLRSNLMIIMAGGQGTRRGGRADGQAESA